MKPTSQLDPLQTSAAFQLFAYPAVAGPALPSWDAFGIQMEEGVPFGNRTPEEPGERNPTWQAQLAAERRLSFEQGRERGFEEGRTAERQALATELEAKEAGRAAQIAHVVEKFHEEKAGYFEAVEHEVVKLALALAARILRREAQMDPLLLTGAVRVALGQLSSSTEVRLRVPPADQDLWADAIAHLPNLPVKPAVVAGEDMRLGECVLEAELGSVNLGVAAQLAEIERGFFDGRVCSPAGGPATKIDEDMSE